MNNCPYNIRKCDDEFHRLLDRLYLKSIGHGSQLVVIPVKILNNLLAMLMFRYLNGW